MMRLIELAERLPERKKKSTALATATAMFAPGAVASAGTLGLLAGVTTERRNPSSLADRDIMRSLKNEAKNVGYSVKNTSARDYSSFIPNKKIAAAMSRAMPGTAHPVMKHITYSDHVRAAIKPGILAHEVGHAKDSFINSRGGQLAYAAGKNIPGIASLVSAVTSNEKAARNSAIIGTAAALPMLGAELKASVTGVKLLRKAGMRGIRTLSPGIGLASYAAMGAVPAATYKLKKAMHGYKEKKEFSAIHELGAKLPDLRADRFLFDLAKPGARQSDKLASEQSEIIARAIRRAREKGKFIKDS